MFLIAGHSQLVFAKTVCAMTFNSSNEKEVFKKHLSPLGYDFKELVPPNKNPNWLKEQCLSSVKCDILLISGHFGGIFFGEQLSSTLSLNEIEKYKNDNRCSGIFKNPRSIYLMGCNTLSGKTPDHRSVSDYLRVLVGDGFPIDLAEEVAASRYLDFGLSIADQMKSNFSSSSNLIGFESTGPLGAQAAPLLERAFLKSSRQEKINSGLNLNALKESFKGTNLRIVTPEKNKFEELKLQAISEDKEKSLKAWIALLAPNTIRLQYDFLIKNIKNENLQHLLLTNDSIFQLVKNTFRDIYRESEGLINVQLKSLSVLKDIHSVGTAEYEKTLSNLVESLLYQEIDYVMADQLCKILKENVQLKLLSRIKHPNLFQRSQYYQYMRKCSGEKILSPKSTSEKCLLEKKDHDWACLTTNEEELTVEACKVAKSRNSDPENADDMMWYCYSKMLEHRQLDQAKCLELTHQFSLLGNQIKMNWNCNNRLKNQF